MEAFALDHERLHSLPRPGLIAAEFTQHVKFLWCGAIPYLSDAIHQRTELVIRMELTMPLETEISDYKTLQVWKHRLDQGRATNASTRLCN